VDPVKAMLDDLRELRAEVDHRYRTLRRLPPSVCPEGKLTEDLARNPQAQMPLVLVAIDEVQRAFGHREYGAELAEVLEDLVKVAPGAGIMVEAATQKPDQKSTPTAFRDQFTVRFALRVTTFHASEAILGAGAYGEGMDASKLSPEAKGAGLLRGTGDTGSVEGGRTVRTYLADGADAEATAGPRAALDRGHVERGGAGRDADRRPSRGLLARRGPARRHGRR
jgi:S-DNA-T family DNA segregation ATPase FtsK/SpoIIIE